MSENLFPKDKGEFLSLEQIHARLEQQRLQDMSPAPWASPSDYTKLQGGVPNLYENRENGLTTIIHPYADGSPAVVSHKSIEDYGTTKIGRGIPGLRQTNSYATALLWSKHGGPCESQSKKSGGQGYDRKS